MAKYFNVEKALASGVPQEQIDEFIKQNKLVAKPFTQPTAQPATPTATPMPEINPQVMNAPSFSERVGQGVVDIGKSIVSPFAKTGKNVAGAVIQAPLAGVASNLATIVMDESQPQEKRDRALKRLREINQLNKLMAPFAESGKSDQSYKNTVGQVVIDPQVRKQVGASLEMASYGVPVGKGANFLTKATLPSIASGVIGETGRELQTESGDVNLNKVIGSGVVSGLAGTAVYGATKIPNLLNKMGGQTEKVGNNIIRSQYRVRPTQAGSLNMRQTVSKLHEYGINNVDDVAEKADKVIPVIEDSIQETVSKANKVDLTGMDRVVREIVDDPSIKVGQDEKIVKFMDKLVKKITSQGKGSQLTYEADPNATLDVIRILEKKASDVVKGKLPTSITDEERALSSAYRFLADEMKDRLYIQAGADLLVPGSLSDDAVRKLSEISPKLAQDVQKATTIAERRSLMAPFVRGKQAAIITDTYVNAGSQDIGGIVKGVGKMVQNPLNIVAVPLGSNKANSVIGGITSSVGNTMKNIPKTPNAITNTATYVGSRIPGLVENSTQNIQPNSNQNEQEPQNYETSNNIQGDGNHIDTSIDQLTTPVKSGKYTLEEMYKALAKATELKDKKGATAIRQMIEDERNFRKDMGLDTTLGSKLSATQKTLIAEVDTGEELLNDLEVALDKFSDKVGPLRGQISKRNVYDTDAQVLQSQVKSTAQIIGRALEKGVLRKEDIPKYEAMLPNLTDTPAVARGKIEKVRTLLRYQKQFLMNNPYEEEPQL